MNGATWRPASCHGMKPHPKASLIKLQLDTHAERIACQTCHIRGSRRGGVGTMTD